MTEEEINQWAEGMLVVIANASPLSHPVALVGSLWVSKTNKNRARVVESNTAQVTFILNERIGLTYSAGRFFATYREV
jgi:hypothetical protein